MELNKVISARFRPVIYRKEDGIVYCCHGRYIGHYRTLYSYIRQSVLIWKLASMAAHNLQTICMLL